MPQPALLAHDLVRTLGGRRVLDGVSLTAAPGHRIGLIGENGVGKSTLLRTLAGVEEPDAGSVTRPGDLGFLHQEMPYDAEATVAAVLDEALREAREDLAELDLLGARLARAPEDDPGHPGTPTAAQRWCWTAWASARSGTTARSDRSPAGSVPDWPWPRCWYGAPPRCSSTSRPTTWTTMPPPSWRSRSAASPGPC
ncbi:hypothetical protein GCM10020295_78370 [Streptomyces cinereospinus]